MSWHRVPDLSRNGVRWEGWHKYHDIVMIRGFLRKAASVKPVSTSTPKSRLDDFKTYSEKTRGCDKSPIDWLMADRGVRPKSEQSPDLADTFQLGLRFDQIHSTTTSAFLLHPASSTSSPTAINVSSASSETFQAPSVSFHPISLPRDPSSSA